VPEQAQDLINKLLTKDPKTRLGVNGASEILEHPWFADLDMDALLQKQVTPPYRPSNKADFAYFD